MDFEAALESTIKCSSFSFKPSRMLKMARLKYLAVYRITFIVQPSITSHKMNILTTLPSSSTTPTTANTTTNNKISEAKMTANVLKHDQHTHTHTHARTHARTQIHDTVCYVFVVILVKFSLLRSNVVVLWIVYILPESLNTPLGSLKWNTKDGNTNITAPKPAKTYSPQNELKQQIHVRFQPYGWRDMPSLVTYTTTQRVSIATGEIPLNVKLLVHSYLIVQPWSGTDQAQPEGTMCTTPFSQFP